MPQDYRTQAANCFVQSQRSKNINSRVLLLRLAQAWIELADQTQLVPVNPSHIPLAGGDALNFEGSVA